MDDLLEREDQEARPNDQGLTLPGAAQLGGVLSRDDEPCCEDRPAGITAARMHNVSIHPLDYGWNVKIGCQNFAVETVEKLIKNLEAYLKDPSGTERQWMADKKLL